MVKEEEAAGCNPTVLGFGEMTGEIVVSFRRMIDFFPSKFDLTLTLLNLCEFVL